MVLTFVGTAHPRAPPKRAHVADFNNAEIATTDLGRKRGSSSEFTGTPILVEHEDPKVGRIMTSWQGPGGSFRVLGRVYDKAAEDAIRSGRMRGLSLGTQVIQSQQAAAECSTDGLHRAVHEVSICEVPRRHGCYVHEVDGQEVDTLHCASNKGSTSRRRQGACQKRTQPIRLTSVRYT